MKYRMLEAGEVIQGGDEALINEFWEATSRAGDKVYAHQAGNYRRPIPEVHASMEPVLPLYTEYMAKHPDMDLSPIDATAHANSEWPDEQQSAEVDDYRSLAEKYLKLTDKYVALTEKYIELLNKD